MNPPPHFEYGFPDLCSNGDDPFDLLGLFAAWRQAALDRGYQLHGMPLESAPAHRVAVLHPKNRLPTRNLINFASYNYLGLSYRKEVIDAAASAVKFYGLGSMGAPLLSGTTNLHKQLMNDLAAFMGQQDALLFPTGYSANLGVISGLMRPGDTIIADQFAHASIVDGIRLAGIRPRFFRHNDAIDLDKKLGRSTGRKLVVVEGVYSMHGDTGALKEIVDACQRHRARILIDEAHSAFLYGPNGRGVAEHLGVYEDIDIVMGTTSKTLGGMGGFVTGSSELIEYLRAYATPQVFSGGLPPSIVAGLLKSIEIVRREPHLRAKLWSNVLLMRERLHQGGVDTGRSTSQVISIMVRDDAAVFTITEALFEHGVYINPIVYPAVPRNQSRLRMAISAGHSESEIEEGARIVVSVLGQYGKLRQSAGMSARNRPDNAHGGTPDGRKN